MREIKFRAWDKTEERFWYFDLNEVLKRFVDINNTLRLKRL